MRILHFLIAMVLLAAAPTFTQLRPEDHDFKLPSGKSQKEEILKSDHEKSLKDADELMKLSEELKIELEKNDRHVLSVSTLKKLEEIEKIAKRIRNRMKRY